MVIFTIQLVFGVIGIYILKIMWHPSQHCALSTESTPSWGGEAGCCKHPEFAFPWEVLFFQEPVSQVDLKNPFLQMLVSVLIVLYLLTNVYLKKVTWADGTKFNGRKACKVKSPPLRALHSPCTWVLTALTAVRADACACTSCLLFVSLVLTFSNGHVREPRGHGAKLIVHRGPFPPSKVPTWCVY